MCSILTVTGLDDLRIGSPERGWFTIRGVFTFKIPVLSDGAVRLALRSPNSLAAAHGSGTPSELMGGFC